MNGNTNKRKRRRTGDGDNFTNTSSHVEQNTGNASNEQKNTAGFTSPCRIHFHHIRKRLADIDGVSGKAVIDGLVHEKILQDDSPKYVKEVTHSQEKGEPEMTIITIEEI